jgi:hypothetical protein
MRLTNQKENDVCMTRADDIRVGFFIYFHLEKKPIKMLRNARVERRRRNIHEIFSHSKNNRGLT